MRDVIFRALQGLLWLILGFALIVVVTNLSGMNFVHTDSELIRIRESVGQATAYLCATIAASALTVIYRPRP